MRLSRATSWIGATETLVSPPSLRERVYAFAQTPHVSRAVDGPLATYLSRSETMANVIEELGDRVAPDELRYEFDGDAAPARDLVAAAPSLATL